MLSPQAGLGLAGAGAQCASVSATLVVVVAGSAEPVSSAVQVVLGQHGGAFDVSVAAEHLVVVD